MQNQIHTFTTFASLCYCLFLLHFAEVIKSWNLSLVQPVLESHVGVSWEWWALYIKSISSFFNNQMIKDVSLNLQIKWIKVFYGSYNTSNKFKFNLSESPFEGWWKHFLSVPQLQLYAHPELFLNSFHNRFINCERSDFPWSHFLCLWSWKLQFQPLTRRRSQVKDCWEATGQDWAERLWGSKLLASDKLCKYWRPSVVIRNHENLPPICLRIIYTPFRCFFKAVSRFIKVSFVASQRVEYQHIHSLDKPRQQKKDFYFLVALRKIESFIWNKLFFVWNRINTISSQTIWCTIKL